MNTEGQDAGWGHGGCGVDFKSVWQLRGLPISPKSILIWVVWDG